MRYAFGLVGLLVCVFIMMYAFANHTAAISKVAVREQSHARQMAGRDETTGEDASRALTLDLAQRGSKVIGVKVTAVVPDSSMEKVYGIKANDVITQAGDMPLGDPFVNDTQSAAGLILKAFQESKPLIVTRAGQSVSLPLAPGIPAPAPTPSAPDPLAGPAPDPLAGPGPTAGTTTPPSAQPAPPPANQKQAPTQKGGLQRQLDIIRSSGSADGNGNGTGGGQ
jgi:hypothetical protein